MRGENTFELTKVKDVVLFAIFVANNLKLETEHFFDQCGTMLDAPREIQDDGESSEVILSASPCIKFNLDMATLTAAAEAEADADADELASLSSSGSASVASPLRKDNPDVADEF